MKPPRFYPILDSDALAARGVDSCEAARALVDAGVQLAQFRHKGNFGREAFRTAEAVGRILRDGGCRYIVNDRVDLALAAGADGVHLGQQDLPPSAARRVAGERFWIGFSTHHADQVQQAAREPVDYVAYGPIFGTVSKRNPDPAVGVADLGRLRAEARRPLVAIGGIRLERAHEVLDAGADSVAVIAGWLDGDWKTSLAAWMRL